MSDQGSPWYTYETTVGQHRYQVELTVYGDPITIRRERRTCWWRSPHLVLPQGNAAVAVEQAQQQHAGSVLRGGV